jgi:hypothetical protein
MFQEMFCVYINGAIAMNICSCALVLLFIARAEASVKTCTLTLFAGRLHVPQLPSGMYTALILLHPV